MSNDIYPVRWAGRQAVVTLPEPKVSNANQISEELLPVINRGAASLITGLTARWNSPRSALVAFTSCG